MVSIVGMFASSSAQIDHGALLVGLGLERRVHAKRPLNRSRRSGTCRYEGEELVSDEEISACNAIIDHRGGRKLASDLIDECDNDYPSSIA